MRLPDAMADQRATGELRKAIEISGDEIDAAVIALPAKPGTGSYPIGGGDLLDLAVAVEAHEPARTALASGEATCGFRRAMARTAILITRLDKA